ncbi:hypothetical protein [Sphaerotilus mobilis]|uniref:Uncharacterized protein n=1 Tax=Sphaerotilus mobilis TaxID=47994 RepID=A0A4Q7LHE5_9BURK|nr:hypothetical protein [Sphaerotilus mobilis]RZS53147.1 hypothetical protein EV685_2772 [Sphaerotilus mobilis]
MQHLAEAAKTHVIGVVMRRGMPLPMFLMTPALRDPASMQALSAASTR